MVKKSLVALVTLACFVATIIVLWAASTPSTIRSVGQIKTVETKCYWDAGLTDPATFIDWGVVTPGSQTLQRLYIVNTSNVPATFSLATYNWVPSNANNSISLSWNYANQTVNVGEVLLVTLTLSVSPTITGIRYFNFTILIAANG